MYYLPIKSSEITRLTKGYPWVYTHSLQSKKPLAAKPGDLVTLVDNKHRPFAIGYYNPHTKLACRILSLNPKNNIDQNFFYHLFTKALNIRKKLFSVPFYRLVHAEGDGLPGLVIDRFGDTLVCQTNTAGMENLKPLWLAALNELLGPQRIIFRDNVPVRQKEGLPLEISAPLGELSGLITLQENNITFFADPENGQKTGWFYDQRANRHWVAKCCAQKTVLDLYTFSGGFGISAAHHQAKHVTLVDASESALTLAKMAAHTNDVEKNCEFIKENVFTLLPQLIESKKTFDVVIADPPAFVKQAKHKGQGLRGYYKLAKLASSVVAPGGLLFIASCSHHASVSDFKSAVEKGITKANRQFTLIRKGGADKDHPIHPMLAENHYLKSLTYKLD